MRCEGNETKAKKDQETETCPWKMCETENASARKHEMHACWAPNPG